MKRFFFLLFVFLFPLYLLAEHFPICMYGVNNPADLPLLKKAGFNCVQTYQTSPELLSKLAAAAQKHHMQLVIAPQTILDSAYQSQAQHWPILAWYLVDEPDVWKWSRARVQDINQRTKKAFPAHQTALVIGQGKTAVPYYDLADNLMMDWYPVPHLALTSFGDNVRFAKEGQIAMGVTDRPLWGVVQTFDWKEFKQHRPDHDRIGRFPTEAEIRFMSYDGILNGATGIFYFIFTSQGQPLPKAQPQWWARVKAVSKQLAKLRPVLEEGTLVENPVEVSAPLAAQTRLHKNYLYTILINRSGDTLVLPNALLNRQYKLLFDGKKSPQMPPYSVWILKRKK